MNTNSLLNELIGDYPSEIEFDPGFEQMVIDHFPDIRIKGHYSEVRVETATCLVFKGDFHGLLKNQQLQTNVLNILTYFNGFTKSSDFDGRQITFLKISPQYLETLKKAYQARRQ